MQYIFECNHRHCKFSFSTYISSSLFNSCIATDCHRVARSSSPHGCDLLQYNTGRGRTWPRRSRSLPPPPPQPRSIAAHSPAGSVATRGRLYGYVCKYVHTRSRSRSHSSDRRTEGHSRPPHINTAPCVTNGVPAQVNNTAWILCVPASTAMCEVTRRCKQ